MQITTIHKIQHVLDNSLKVLKFVWRHVLTLIVFGMMLFATIVVGKISWINCGYFYIGAILLDWLKMKFKSTGTNNAHEQMFESAHRSMDSSRFGSSAWATNPGMIGSPANHLYNLGSRNNYD